MTSRKTILDTLTSRLASATGITSASRSLRTIDDLTTADLPCVFVTYLGEQVRNSPHQPCVYSIQVALTLFTAVGSLDGSIDSVLASIQRKPTESGELNTTLGGIVQTVNVTSIEADEGLSSDMAAGAQISLEIEAVGD